MSPLVHSTHSTALRPIRSLTMYDTASLHVLSSRVSSTLSATSLYFDRPMDCRICEHRDDDKKQKQYRMQVIIAVKHYSSKAIMRWTNQTTPKEKHFKYVSSYDCAQQSLWLLKQRWGQFLPPCSHFRVAWQKHQSWGLKDQMNWDVMMMSGARSWRVK